MRATKGKGHAAAALVVRHSEDVPQAPGPVRMGIELKNPVTEHLEAFCRENRRIFDIPEMVQPNTCMGRTLAICGAGPSLEPALIRGVDDVWACNSALPWLVSQGAKVDYGVGIDQTPGLLREWSDPPDVPYLVATTCDPALVRHLIDRGRRVVFFHNFVAWGPDERDYYCNGWPPAFMLGEGATVVSRVIGLAAWMGYERLDVHGADCAFKGDIVHANGDTLDEAYGPNTVVMEGEINGRKWRARPDMLMGAVDLARRTQLSQGHVRLMGDTLAVALLGKGDAYLDEVMRRLKPGEIPEG